jgi:tripartite-type tricarboxylate transporter receptor subunit TctC
MSFQKINPFTKALLGLAWMVTIPTLAQPSVQESSQYPLRPVRVLMPFAAGSGLDQATRQVARLMGEQLGQPLVVENRAGAVGTVGMIELAKAPPDGYTLAYTNSAIAVSQWLLAKGRFQLPRDTTPIGLMSFSFNVLVTAPELPAASVADLVSMLKAKPGAYSYASGGNGTPAHLQGEIFRRSLGLDVVHVPYKALSAALVDMGRGDVHYMFGISSSVMPALRAGRAKALAVAAPQRLSVMPDMPTMEELGFQGMDVRSWGAIAGPPGMPSALVERLNRVLRGALEDPSTRKLWDTLGLTFPDPAATAAATTFRSESERWERFLKDVVITID